MPLLSPRQTGSRFQNGGLLLDLLLRYFAFAVRILCFQVTFLVAWYELLSAYKQVAIVILVLQ